MANLHEQVSKLTLDLKPPDTLNASGARFRSANQSRFTVTPARSTLRSNKNSESPGFNGPFITNWIQDDAYKKVDELQKHLSTQIDEMDSKIENALKKQDRLFVSAYREHMQTIQQELAELQRRFHADEVRTYGDKRFVELQKKTDLYRDEALRIREECDKIKKENDNLRARISILIDEKNFLTNYINFGSERTKKIREEVGRALNESYLRTHNKSNKSFSGSEISPNHSFTRGRKVSKPTTPIRDLEDSQSRIDQSFLPRLDADLMSPLERFEKLIKEIKQANNLQNAIEKVEKTGLALVQDLENKVNRLTKALQRETKEKNKMLQRQAADQASELEKFFVECVDQVRKEIFKRKILAQKTFNHLKEGEIQEESPQPDMALVKKNVDLGKFLVNDKMKLLEIFLTNEEVLYYIYEGVFGRGKKKNPMQDESKIDPSTQIIKASEENTEQTKINTSHFLTLLEEDDSNRELEEKRNQGVGATKMLKELSLGYPAKHNQVLDFRSLYGIPEVNVDKILELRKIDVAKVDKRTKESTNRTRGTSVGNTITHDR